MAKISTHDLWADGQSMTISTGSMTPGSPVTTTSGSLTLTWTVPNNPIAYDGAIVTLSTAPFTNEEFPLDSTIYAASTAFGSPSSPNGTIGNAQVVAAYYGFFGNTPITTVTVTGLNPNQIYYASVHAASNVLQYYTLGVQSYPLPANPDSPTNVTPYAGSIPKLNNAPLNPTDGQIYYDIGSNTVLMWTDEQSAWIEANNGNTVMTGPTVNVDIASLFFLQGDNNLQFFDGTQWVICNGTNLRVKNGGSYVPYTGLITVSGSYPTTPAPVAGDFLFIVYQAQLSAPPTSYIKFYSLGQWFNITPGLVQVNIGGTWTNIYSPSYWSSFGAPLPRIPHLGKFFYNTSTQQLLSWAGATAGWIRADTEEIGVPTTAKVGIGTDGTDLARTQLMTNVMSQLGYPSICVELSPAQISLAIDNALAEFRRRSDSAVREAMIPYTLNGNTTGNFAVSAIDGLGVDGNASGQQIYYLNDPSNDTDKIVSIRKIHRLNMLGISSISASNGIFAQCFFNQLMGNSAGMIDVTSIHLISQLSKTYEKIFVGQIEFIWNEAKRTMTLLRNVIQTERVILDVLIEKEESELINDRYAKMWIQNWAYAEGIEMLGLIRSKYGTLPGATGGLTLNGDTLLAMASEKKTELLRQITDMEVDNVGIETHSYPIMIG
jgi:hypothetical protein